MWMGDYIIYARTLKDDVVVASSMAACRSLSIVFLGFKRRGF